MKKNILIRLIITTNRNELKKIRDYLIKFKEKNFTRMVKFTKDFEDLINSVLLK